MAPGATLHERNWMGEGCLGFQDTLEIPRLRPLRCAPGAPLGMTSNIGRAETKSGSSRFPSRISTENDTVLVDLLVTYSGFCAIMVSQLPLSAKRRSNNPHVEKKLYGGNILV